MRVFIQLNHCWHRDGSGNVFRKFGCRVVYAISDLHEWDNAGTFTSTSESDAYQRWNRRYDP